MIGPQLPPEWQTQQQHKHQQEQEHVNSTHDQDQPGGKLVPVTQLKSLYKLDVGAGLLNLGNTCYMNSVLQCLAHLPPLACAYQAGKLHGFPFACPLKRHGIRCACCIVQQQLNSQTAANGVRIVRPDAISNNLGLLSKTFVRGRQEDAHEFLLAVLDAAERDARKACTALGLPKVRHTLIEQLFCGQLVSQVQCSECGHCSNTYETVTTLSLDIHRASSVEHSLQQFTAAETLDGANKYKCDKCNRLVRARKAFGVHDDPNVLVIHLKRFNALSLSAKIGRHVEFKQVMTLPKLGSSSSSNGSSPANSPAGSPPPANKRPFYMLTGVVVHQGSSVHLGHYYAYVRDSTGKWFCANDSNVYGVSRDHVMQQQAYLLFYTRSAMKMPQHGGQQAAGPAAAGAASATASVPLSPTTPASTTPSAGLHVNGHSTANGNGHAAHSANGDHAGGLHTAVQHGQHSQAALPPAKTTVTLFGSARTSFVLKPKAAPTAARPAAARAPPPSGAKTAETGQPQQPSNKAAAASAAAATALAATQPPQGTGKVQAGQQHQQQQQQQSGRKRRLSDEAHHADNHHGNVVAGAAAGSQLLPASTRQQIARLLLDSFKQCPRYMEEVAARVREQMAAGVQLEELLTNDDDGGGESSGRGKRLRAELRAAAPVKERQELIKEVMEVMSAAIGRNMKGAGTSDG